MAANKIILKCKECGKKHTLNPNSKASPPFYKCYNFDGKNRIYRDTGYYNICKQCVNTMCIKDNGEFDLNAFKGLLENYFDRPFYQETFDKVYQRAKNVTGIIGQYFKDLNLNFADETWDSIIENKTKKNKTEDEYISSDLEEKWGIGYSKDEYLAFEKKWKLLIDNYGKKTSFHIENLKTYIRFRVKEEIATAEGNISSAKQWAAMADKAGENAKINVKQLSKSDLSGGVDLVCQIFEAVESEVGIIPLLPKLTEQPYDDADMVIWCVINYGRRLEGKERISYKDIWSFYDEMLEEYCIQQGMDKKQIKEFKEKRNNVFRDLEKVYNEPVYGENDT